MRARTLVSSSRDDGDAGGFGMRVSAFASSRRLVRSGDRARPIEIDSIAISRCVRVSSTAAFQSFVRPRGGGYAASAIVGERRDVTSVASGWAQVAMKQRGVPVVVEEAPGLQMLCFALLDTTAIAAKYGLRRGRIVGETFEE